MKELLFKSSTSTANHKRDLWFKETIEKDGVLAKTERRCLYFVLGKTRIEDPNDIEKLSELKLKDVPYKKRHYYVLKVHDSQHGVDKLICKIAGTFYAVSGNEIYGIAFVHSFKIAFTNLALKEKD